MSTLRPIRLFGPRGFIGCFFGRADAEAAAPRMGRAVIIDEQTGQRWCRIAGCGWVSNGHDRLTLKRLAARAAAAATSYSGGDAA